MSDLPPRSFTLSQAKHIFTTKTECYHAISRIYKLPALTSRAISKKYLIECMKEECSVFRIEHKDFYLPYIHTRYSTSIEVLEAIEQLLKRKNLPSTGFNRDTLPDWNWLIGVYFFLDEKDELGLFPNSRKIESKKMAYSIDPRILKAVEDIDLPPRRRSIIKFDEETKRAYKKEVLERRLIRRKRIENYITEKLEAYERSTRVLAQKLADSGKTQDVDDKGEPELEKKLKIFDEQGSI